MFQVPGDPDHAVYIKVINVGNRTLVQIDQESLGPSRTRDRTRILKAMQLPKSARLVDTSPGVITYELPSRRSLITLRRRVFKFALNLSKFNVRSVTTEFGDEWMIRIHP